MSSLYYLFAASTFLFCSGIVVMILLRLNCGRCRRARLKYTVVLLAALVAAMQPYFSDRFPGVGSAMLALGMLWLLVDGASALKKYKDSDHFCYDTQMMVFDEND